MRFFQRLNICEKCGVAFKPQRFFKNVYTPAYRANTRFCMTHEIEHQEEKRKDLLFFAWVEKNRKRLESQRVSEEKKDEEIRRENNAALAAAYGSQNPYKYGMF